MPVSIHPLTQGLAAERYVMPLIDSNMYVLRSREGVLIVDPSADEALFESLRKERLMSVMVLLTHEHIDHISGVNRLRTLFPQTQVICTKACAEQICDAGKNLARFWDVLFIDRSRQERLAARDVLDKGYTCQADETFEEEFSLSFAGHIFRLQAAPGHSPGGMLIFLDDIALFTGDNLVEGNGVICRFPDGNRQIWLEKTLPIIHSLNDETFILPGHGNPGRLGGLRQYLRMFEPGDRA